MVVTLVIAGILLAITVPRIGLWRNEYAVRNARNALVSLGARAQAAALERGGVVCVKVYPGPDDITMVEQGTGGTLEELSYDGIPFRAAFSTKSGDLVICYTLRGFAPPSLNTGLPDTVTFTIGQARAQAAIHPLGRIEPI